MDGRNLELHGGEARCEDNIHRQVSPSLQSPISTSKLTTTRPGFGGSTAVPIHLRISVFLETVPLLLSHLNITHLSLLASHSSGILFALNTLYHLPHLLSPSSPRVMLFAPWVHQSISSVSILQAAALLPDPLLNQWNGLIGFIVKKALPNPVVSSSIGAFGASSGILSSVGSLWSGERMSKEEKKAEAETGEKRCMELCGYGLEMKKLLGEKSVQYAFAENTQGGNDEARLCLKSVPNIDWDAYESLPTLMAHLKEVWTQKVQRDGCAGLKLQLVFGESDIMIGNKGRKYFEESWVNEDFGNAVKVEVMEVKGGDHDSVVDPMMGAVELMMSLAKE